MDHLQNGKEDGVRVEEFHPSSGKTVTLRSVSPLLIQKINATIKEPEPPTYKMQTLTGEIEFAYDEQSIQDESVSDEEKARWRKYLEEKEGVERQRREKLIDILFAKGVEVAVPDDGWEDDQRFLGLEVPENPTARRIHYLQTEVFTSAQDLTDAIAKLMQLTAGITDEDMSDIRASFRGAVQRASAEGLAAEDSDEQPKRGRGRSSKSTAPAAEGVDL